MQGSFSVSPSEYHRAHRNGISAGRAFVGPWNYAGASPGSNVRQQYNSPQSQPKAASSPRRGFVSPVGKGLVKTKTYNYGANRTQALSEE